MFIYLTTEKVCSHFLAPFPHLPLWFVFFCLGGNQRGVFALALVQGEWKVYVSGLLDREQQDYYLLNITASDGLYVAHTAVEVTVMDANDNSPICKQVREEDMKRWCILIRLPLTT